MGPVSTSLPQHTVAANTKGSHHECIGIYLPGEVMQHFCMSGTLFEVAGSLYAYMQLVCAGLPCCSQGLICLLHVC